MSLPDNRYDAELAAVTAWVRERPEAAARALLAYRHWQGDGTILSYAHTLVDDGAAKHRKQTTVLQMVKELQK